FVPWLLSSQLRANNTLFGCVVWLGVAWVVTFGTWWVVRRAGRARPGMMVPLVGMLALATDAWLLRRHGAGLAWEISGVGAIALLVAVGTAAWRQPFVCGTGAALCITIAHVGLLWCGHGSRELRSSAFLLALAVPWPLWLATAKGLAQRKRFGAFCVGLASASLAAVAIGLA
ncbi:MAG: hypothetical protein JNL12_05940, partial [Planctomycetes bacterium]|nr:hypothetical protein [Planctomycetota bacterium]